MSATDNFRDRLDFQGDFETLINTIVHDFGFDAVTSFSVVTSGFEDCNFVVETGGKKLFVKCYAKIRTPGDIQRNIQVLDAVANSDVHHPHLYRTAEGSLLTAHGKVSAVVMDYIDGESFHGLGRIPTDQEAALVIAEAAKIHRLPVEPTFIYDSIAVVNLPDMYKRIQAFLTAKDADLLLPVIKSYGRLELDELPKAFVHGDLITTNVLLDKQGKVWVVDFSVANTYPKIIELAVIASSLLFGRAGSLPEKVEKILEVYETVGGQLTAQEKAAVLPLARAAQAMELMGGYQYKYINKDNIEEAEHWQKVGREGLLAE